VNLGTAPLTAGEAQAAWQALQVARNLPAETAANAAYQGLTAITFAIMQANAFWARFWPALAGASLALVPFFWRRKLSPFLTIGLALALALDPVLFILSRQAGSAIFVVAGLVWALTFFIAGKPIGVGVALALALLGGPWVWAALFLLLVGFGLAWLFKRSAVKEFATSLVNICPIRGAPAKFAAGFGVTLLLLATSFGLDPAGLSGIAGGLVAFTQGGFTASQVPTWVQMYRWAAYSISPLVLALVASVRAWKEGLQGKHTMSLHVLLFLLGAVLFANLGAGGLALVQLPLWGLALGEIERLVGIETKSQRAVGLVFIFGLVLCVYLALSLKSWLNASPGTLAFTQQGLAFLLGVVLLGLVYLFTGMGWSYQATGKGLALALMSALLVSTLSLTLSGATFRPENAALIWSDTPVLDSSDEITQLLNEFERLNTLQPETNTVAILEPKLASYAWTFHAFGQVQLPLALPEGENPEVILSDVNWQIKPEQSYRGMNISAYRQIDWAKLQPFDLLKGSFNQNFTTQSTQAILWLRQDLFPGATP
jgi:hypothetical protein